MPFESIPFAANSSERREPEAHESRTIENEIESNVHLDADGECKITQSIGDRSRRPRWGDARRGGNGARDGSIVNSWKFILT